MAGTSRDGQEREGGGGEGALEGRQGGCWVRTPSAQVRPGAHTSQRQALWSMASVAWPRNTVHDSAPSAPAPLSFWCSPWGPPQTHRPPLSQRTGKGAGGEGSRGRNRAFRPEFLGPSSVGPALCPPPAPTPPAPTSPCVLWPVSSLVNFLVFNCISTLLHGGSD